MTTRQDYLVKAQELSCSFVSLCDSKEHRKRILSPEKADEVKELFADTFQIVQELFQLYDDEKTRVDSLGTQAH